MVSVGLHVPSSPVEDAVDVRLSTQSPDIAVLTGGCGIVGHGAIGILTTVTEIVLAAGVKKLGINRTRKHA